MTSASPEPAECGICFEEITTRGKLDVCDHSFCYTCKWWSAVRSQVLCSCSRTHRTRWCDAGIKEWVSESNTCPLCQRRFHALTKVVRGFKLSDFPLCALADSTVCSLQWERSQVRRTYLIMTSGGRMPFRMAQQR